MAWSTHIHIQNEYINDEALQMLQIDYGNIADDFAQTINPHRTASEDHEQNAPNQRATTPVIIAPLTHDHVNKSLSLIHI